MLRAEEIQFNEAKMEFEKAKKALLEAIDWYETSSDNVKKNFQFTENELQNMKWDFIFRLNIPERDYIFDSNSQKISLNDEQTFAENQEIPDFMDLYHKCMITLKELQRYDNLLNEKNEMNESETFLDKSATGNIISTELYDTSILDNYRNWGIERICLDGFQNHLPADSKGTKCFLQFLIDDKWVGYEEAVLHRDKIDKVRFADNGVGFSSKNLKFLSSQKSSEDLSAGQFGEGLKLISMASVNLGLGIEIQSQNWIAKAFGKPETIMNYRNGTATEEQRNQLAWEISTFDGEPIKRFTNYISYTYT